MYLVSYFTSYSTLLLHTVLYSIDTTCFRAYRNSYQLDNLTLQFVNKGKSCKNQRKLHSSLIHPQRSSAVDLETEDKKLLCFSPIYIDRPSVRVETHQVVGFKLVTDSIFQPPDSF